MVQTRRGRQERVENEESIIAPLPALQVALQEVGLDEFEKKLAEVGVKQVDDLQWLEEADLREVGIDRIRSRRALATWKERFSVGLPEQVTSQVTSLALGQSKETQVESTGKLPSNLPEFTSAKRMHPKEFLEDLETKLGAHV